MPAAPSARAARCKPLPPQQGSRSVAVPCLGEALPAPGPDPLCQLRLNFTVLFYFAPKKQPSGTPCAGGEWVPAPTYFKAGAVGRGRAQHPEHRGD